MSKIQDDDDDDEFEDLEKYHYEKFKGIESDYARYVMARHFSNKDARGRKVFDKVVVIDNQTIRASRFPCFQSYLNPILTPDPARTERSASAAALMPPPRSKGKMQAE